MKVFAMVDEIVDKLGRIDILVNNTGGALGQPKSSMASDTEEEYYNYIMAINLSSAVFLLSSGESPDEESGLRADCQRQFAGGFVERLERGRYGV